MARYDYGMRGPGDTPTRRFFDAPRYDEDFEFRHRHYPPMNRVIARYNRDYILEDPRPAPFNPFPYGGEWRGQITGEEGYEGRYQTRGGTRTSRGLPRPFRYDYRDSGPASGGRYPDEL